MFPSCDICQKIFSNKSSLNRHFKNFHNYKRPTTERRPANKLCMICQAKFRSRQSLYFHKRTKHGHLTNDKTNPFTIELQPVLEKSVNSDVGVNDNSQLNTMPTAAQKDLNVSNYTPNDCEVKLEEMTNKVKSLSRRQLEVLICILSREVSRLELLHSACIKEHKSVSHREKETGCDEIPHETVISNVHYAFKSHAAKEGLHIVENQAKSQLDVVNIKDNQLVYRKSWFPIDTHSAAQRSLQTTLSSQCDNKNDFENHTEQETETAVKVSEWTTHSEDLNRTSKDLSTKKQPVKIKPAPVCHSVKLTPSRYKMILPKPTLKTVKILNLSTVNVEKVLIASTKVCPETKTKTFVCEICEKIFGYKSLLNKHLNVVHNYNQMTTLCSYCGKLVLQSRLKAHVEKVHERPTYSCHICHKGFHRRACLEGHVNKHGNMKPYICEFCGRKYAYYTSLVHHKSLCSRALLPAHLQNSKTREDKDVSCICETCGITFVGTSGLKDHCRAKHMNQVQTCNHCGKSFHWRPSYNRHVKKCKDKTDLERTKLRKLAASSPGKKFTCECGKQYPYRQSFRRHQKTCLQNQQLNSYVLASKSLDKICLAEYLH